MKRKILPPTPILSRKFFSAKVLELSSISFASLSRSKSTFLHTRAQLNMERAIQKWKNFHINSWQKLKNLKVTNSEAFEKSMISLASFKVKFNFCKHKELVNGTRGLERKCFWSHWATIKAEDWSDFLIYVANPREKNHSKKHEKNAGKPPIREDPQSVKRTITLITAKTCEKFQFNKSTAWVRRLRLRENHGSKNALRIISTHGF